MKLSIIIMGGCASVPSKTIKPAGTKYHYRPVKFLGKLTHPYGSSRKRTSDARVNDFSVSEFIHTTTTCRTSEVSNSTFQVTQLQWHHNEIDANGIPLFPFFFSNLLY